MPQEPVRVPGQRPLSPSVTSITLPASDKGDNEMIPGAVHRYPGIYLIAEENPVKHQLADHLMKASNGVRYLQMRLLGAHSTSGMEKEGNKERTE